LQEKQQECNGISLEHGNQKYEELGFGVWRKLEFEAVLVAVAITGEFLVRKPTSVYVIQC